jgi:anti-sigma regulatory factor (Ser/Thr protein kinase)
VVRALVHRDALAGGLSQVRSAELVSAVNEIVTNSVRHGGGRGAIRVWQEPGAIVCEVRDRGRFDNPLADRQRPHGGLAAPRGLWLANQLCDLVQIRSLPDGAAVRLRMRRNVRPQLRVMPDRQPDPGPEVG